MENYYPWENYDHSRPNQISIWAERYFLKGTFHLSDPNPTHVLTPEAVASAHFFRVTPAQVACGSQLPSTSPPAPAAGRPCGSLSLHRLPRVHAPAGPSGDGLPSPPITPSCTEMPPI